MEPINYGCFYATMIGKGLQGYLFINIFKLQERKFVVSCGLQDTLTSIDLAKKELINLSTKAFMYYCHPRYKYLKITDIDLQTLKKCLVAVLPNAVWIESFIEFNPVPDLRNFF